MANKSYGRASGTRAICHGPATRSVRRLRHALPAVTAWLLLTLAGGHAEAQPRYVRLTGWVQWIAGQKLMLVLDNGGGVVPVDLSSVPIDNYGTLSERDQIAVTGVVSQDNRGVFGLSIARIPDGEPWEGQGP
jgi:hypothetical protein